MGIVVASAGRSTREWFRTRCRPPSPWRRYGRRSPRQPPARGRRGPLRRESTRRLAAAAPRRRFVHQDHVRGLDDVDARAPAIACAGERVAHAGRRPISAICTSVTRRGPGAVDDRRRAKSPPIASTAMRIMESGDRNTDGEQTHEALRHPPPPEGCGGQAGATWAPKPLAKAAASVCRDRQRACPRLFFADRRRRVRCRTAVGRSVGAFGSWHGGHGSLRGSGYRECGAWPYGSSNVCVLDLA